jgi:hypothetical protein
MKRKEEFRFSEIKKEFLKNASPEFVYDWIKQNADSVGGCLGSSKGYPRDDTPIIEMLKSRDNVIIDLALAQFSADEMVLKELFNSENRALRVAVLANQYRDYEEWITQEQLKDLCVNGKNDELEAHFSNPQFQCRDLESVFLRKAPYSEIPDNRWILILQHALENPGMVKPEVENPYDADGYLSYLDSVPRYAVWKMLGTIPNTVENASRLCLKFANIASFEGSLDRIFENQEKKDKNEFPKDSSQPLKTGIKLPQKIENGELISLKRLLDRWSGANMNDQDAFDSKGKEDFSLRLLREAIASKLSTYNSDLMGFIKNHDDIHVRRGYYKIFRCSKPEELKTYFKKDANDFLEPALTNRNLYSSYPKGIATVFYGLVHGQRGDEEFSSFEDSQRYRAQYDCFAEKLNVENPNNFKFDEFLEPIAPKTEEDLPEMPEMLATVYELNIEISQELGLIKQSLILIDSINTTSIHIYKRAGWILFFIILIGAIIFFR